MLELLFAGYLLAVSRQGIESVYLSPRFDTYTECRTHMQRLAEGRIIMLLCEPFSNIKEVLQEGGQT